MNNSLQSENNSNNKFDIDRSNTNYQKNKTFKLNDYSTENKKNDFVNFNKEAKINDINKKLNISKLNKQKEFRYKKLSQEMQDFCKNLDDYNKDNLLNKLNEKLRTNLSEATYNEIREYETKMNFN